MPQITKPHREMENVSDKFVMVGNVPLQPGLVTHIDPHRDGLSVHFVGGSTRSFTKPEECDKLREVFYPKVETEAKGE